MSISKDTIVDALRLRYDAYSAETIFELACNRAELQGKTTFEGRELAAFRAALEKVGDRVGNVLARLDALSGNPPPTSDAKPADVKAEKSDAKAVPAETKSEKSDSKPIPTETKSEKSDSKPNPMETKSEKSDSKPNKKDKKGDAKSEPEPKTEAKTDAKPGDAKAPDAKAVETTISLRGIDVGDGEQLMICGAFPELGDWDPERARPLVREGDQWQTKLQLAPDAEISFKFLRKNAAGKITWEAGDNRQVRGSQRLDATWRTDPAS